MNKKIFIKLICILIALFLSSFILMNNYSIAGPLEDINSLMSKTTDADTNNTEVIQTTQDVMVTIIRIIQIIGVGVAVIMLVYIAIKYMMAAPDGKADFKKSAVPFIVGAVILFSASAILEIICKFAQGAIQA